ncbi:MAG: hypothetical protein DYG88_01745 [Chloroflexi bacterium CFX4]|nr:hypothetical protein [Chloroflexi bacterium CFX4]MDL1921378.1 hypothetical protein [Chloroflexi bacterium CFX3]
MSVTGLGSRRQAVRLPVLGILSGLLLIAALVLFALELVRFEESRERLQTDITVAGVPVSGLRLAEAVAAWENIYQQPITLEYLGHPIQLLPASIGFVVKSDQMQAEIRAQTALSNSYWQDFWNYLWRRPTNPISVPLIADYSEARLREVLDDIARRYDQAASSGNFDLNTLSFGAGAAGTRLDVDRAIPIVEEALFRPLNRTAKLPMQNEGAKAADMATLRAAILQYVQSRNFVPNGPDTLASVGVIDLQDGAEMWINGDIAYSSASTVKIPILLNTFAQLNFTPQPDIRWLMASSILCSINESSNFLMQVTGQGANARAKLADGLRQVNETMKQVGARYTFINAPLWVGSSDLWSINDNPPPVPNPNFDARPDRWSRTTPEDMAILLQQLYDCAEYGSGLAAAAPEQFTQNECQQMLELLSGNIIGRMIELGVPPGTRVAHKNGWAPGNQSWNNNDAAIVYTPGGNYILVIYTWERLLPGQQVGNIALWEMMEGISRIVYNYFNPSQPMVNARTPENPLTALDCVMPSSVEKLDFTNIRNGRFDANGYLEPDACYGFPNCGVDKPPPSFVRP